MNYTTLVVVVVVGARAIFALHSMQPPAYNLRYPTTCFSSITVQPGGSKQVGNKKNEKTNPE